MIREGKLATVSSSQSQHVEVDCVVKLLNGVIVVAEGFHESFMVAGFTAWTGNHTV